MRRLMKYAMVALCAMSLSACEYDSGTVPYPEGLCQRIWKIAYADLNRANEVLQFVASYNYYLTIEDEAAANEYAMHNLNGPVAILKDGNTHTLVYQTTYETSYTATFEMHDNNWYVKRTGGNSFELNIKFMANGRFSAEVMQLYNNESSGSGALEGHMTYDENGKHEISYVGTLVMVDREASKESPLIVTNNIIEEVVIDRVCIRSGKMFITAEDKLYGTTDEITVTVLKDAIGQIILEWYDQEWGYYI